MKSNKSLKAAFLTAILPLAMLFVAFVQAQAHFQDEFNGSSLDPGWSTWDGYREQYPADTANHAAFQMTGTQLSISIPGGAEHNQWVLRHAQVHRPYLGSGVYEIKVDSAMTGDQQFGLTFQKDHSTFMHFMLFSYGNGQFRAYVERFTLVSGELTRTTIHGSDIPLALPSAGPHYLRVVVDDSANPALRNWKFDWSPDGSSWSEIVAGVFETNVATENAGAIQQVGLFAGNHYGFPAFNAKFDYFRYYTSLETAPLSKPANAAARAGDRRVDLTWDAVPFATSYVVYSIAPDGGQPILLGSTSQPTFAHTNLTNEATYRYAIAGVRSGIEGPSAAVLAVPHVNGLALLPAQGLMLALSASELAYTQASGSAVSVWPSSGGPSLAATSTGSLSPTLVHSAINGQAALRFDGVDDYLTLPSGFQDFTAGMSLYVVMRPSAVASFGFKIVALGNGIGQQNIGLGRAGDTAGFQFWNSNAGGEYSWFNTPSGLFAGETSLVSVQQDGGTSGSSSYAEVTKNGMALFGQNVFVPPVATRAVNYIGKSYWNEGTFQGDIAEIILYNRKLSAQEHATVQTYVANKYGLSMTGSAPTLAAPGGPSATAGNGSVTLNWSAVSGATGYRVYRSLTSGGPYTQMATPTSTSYSDSGLTNGATYYYVVRAFNASLESANSQQVSATPNVASLAVPAGLGATPGNGSVGLSWSAVSGATGYRVYRGTTSGGPYTQVASPTSISYSDTGLTNGTTYYYVVRAFNASLESANSLQVTATPAVPLPGPNVALPAAGRFLVLDAQTAAQQFANGAAVTSWQDISGNARHAVASGAATPVLVTNAINGQAALRFDGVDDYLTLPSGFQDFTAGMSLYVVMRPSAVASFGFKIVALGNGIGQQNIGLGRAGDTAGFQFWNSNAGGEYSWFNTPSGLFAGETSLVSVQQDGGTSGSSSYAEVTKNGMALFGQNVFVPPVATRAVNYIGKSYWNEGTFQGDIAEIILYNRKLSAQEHATVQTYVANKYGLSMTGSAPTLAAPGGPSATAGNGSVTLNWSAVSGATGYRVYRSLTSGGPYTQMATPTSTSYSDSGLTNGATYYYVVRAFNASLESANSQQVSATPNVASLAVPAGLGATPGNGSVGLSWSAVSGATGYRVYRGTTSGGPYTQVASPTSISYSDTGLTNGTTYYYVVRAFNASLESANSLQVTATPAVPLPGPNVALPAAGRFLVLDAQTAAQQFANGAAVTSWQDISGNARHAVASGAATPVLVTNAINGQAALRFDGVDDYLTLPSGFQDFTAGMSLYVVMRPSAVASFGFKIVALGNGIGQQNIGLGRAGDTAGFQFWNSNAGGEYSWFNTPSGLFAGETSLVSVQQDGGTSGSSSYAEVTKNGMALFGQNVFVPPVATRAVNYIGKSYWNEGTFQGDIAEIILYNRKLSAQEHATVQTYVANKYGLSMTGSAPTLAAPGGPSATAGNGSVTLNWSAVSGATGYRVYRSLTSGGPYTQMATPTSTSYSDSGLTNGATYYYVVRAFNASLESANSQQVSATPNVASLAVPAGLGATPGNGSVGLSWSAVSGATGYRVYRGTTSGGPYTQVASPTSISYSDTGLTNGTTYYYVVRAFNASLESANSLQVTATPAVPLPGPNVALPAAGRFLVLDAQTAAQQFANGAAVTSWQDISGNARHAVASGAATPVLVTNAINGQAALRFDGVDDYLTLPSGFQDFTAGMSLYVVMRPSAVASFGFKIVALGNGIGQQNIGLGRAGDTAGFQFWNSNAGGEYSWFNTPSGLFAGETSLVSVQQDGGTSGSSSYAEVTKNGMALFGQNVFVPPVATRAVNYIGKSYWNEGTFQGDIAEIILYNRKLSAQEHGVVKAYIATKYALSVMP